MDNWVTSYQLKVAVVIFMVAYGKTNLKTHKAFLNLKALPV